MTPSASCTPVVNASSTPEEVRTFVEPEPSPIRAKPSPERMGSPRLPDSRIDFAPQERSFASARKRQRYGCCTKCWR